MNEAVSVRLVSYRELHKCGSFFCSALDCQVIAKDKLDCIIAKYNGSLQYKKCPLFSRGRCNRECYYDFRVLEPLI